MRGRRVALLLTGLWPLLAKDDVPLAETNVTADAEEIHLPPSPDKELKRPLDVLTTSNPSNIVMVEHILDKNDVLEELDDRIQENQHVAHDTQATTDEENESVADESKTQLSSNEPEDISDAPTQDDSETNKAKVSHAQVLDHADDSKAEPDVDAQSMDSSQETNGDNKTVEAESSESEDSSQADSETAPPMDEDEDDVGTGRVLVDYASKSAGAIILEKSPAMKGTSNLLNGDNDKYAIAPCAEKKFVVINLSEDILVKQVKLANYERYSSQLKDFQIMGSQTMGDWVDLGTYTAEPGNGEQAFDLKEPAWARYLKFKFVTHYGSEHYCTYSQIKVHGSTMLQGFHEQWDSQEDLGEGNGAESAENEDEGQPSDGVDSKEPDDSGSNEDKLASEATEEQAEGVDTVSDTLANDATAKTNAESTATGNDDTESATNPCSAEVDQGADMSNEAAEQTPDQHQKPPEDEVANDGETGENGPAAVQGSPPSYEKPTLSCASIGISSHVAANAECAGSIKHLDTSSIKHMNKALKSVVTTVVKEMVEAEALMTIDDARTVSHELKDIQESLKAPSLGRIVPREDEKDEMNQSTETVEAVEQIAKDSPSAAATQVLDDDVDNDKDQHDLTMTETNDSSGTKKEEQDKGDVSSDISPDTKHHDKVFDTGVPKQMDNQITAKTIEAAEAAEQIKQAVLDPALSSVIARFPSAACIEGLDYQTFKAKIVAARKERANAQGGHQHPGKNEPIFKLLTDEIKGLQTSQSAQDQYMKALMACYQQVMLEMAETLSHVETRQDKRLLDLEKAMEASKSGFLVKALSFMTAIISSIVFGARFIEAASDTSAEALMALGLVDAKISALLLFAACSVVMFLLGYCVSAFYYKDLKSSAMKKEESNAVEATKQEQCTTRESESNQETPPAVVNTPPPTKSPTQSSLASDVEHSENGSDASGPAVTVPVITLAPCPLKHPDVEHEPLLAPE